MKRILGAFLVVALGAIWVIAAEIPEDKHTIVFEGKLGNVTFHHKDHADREKGNCTACHHNVTGDEMPGACSECHDPKEAKQDGKQPKLKDAVHATCQNCHEERAKDGGKSGPQKKECKGCHVKG